MMCAKKISWVIIILAVSFFGCSNPTGDTTGPVSPRPTWEKLYVKFEVSGLVCSDRGSNDNNMIYHRYEGNWDDKWDSSISFSPKIDSSWRDINSDPPTEPFVYDTKDVVMSSQGLPWPRNLNVSVWTYSAGDGFAKDSRDYLIIKIYVKKTDADDYKLYAQKRGDRPDYRNANLEVILTADLNDYR